MDLFKVMSFPSHPDLLYAESLRETTRVANGGYLLFLIFFGFVFKEVDATFMIVAFTHVDS